LGVAAPIIGNEINFVNINFSFDIKKIKKSFFPGGLRLFNDVQLQGYAINSYPTDKLKSIGSNKNFPKGPKILIIPGTGLGLSILNNGESIATEAGHLNIPNMSHGIQKLLEDFKRENKRIATFEDLLSGKGVSYIYGFLSKESDHNFSNEDILNNALYDPFCDETKKILIEIFAIFTRYTALITGSTGGVYLAGSLSESLLKDNDFLEFRNIFEESKKMDRYLSNIPVFLINENDLGFMGALEVYKNEII
tara:strand:+ start:286 stop:1038 length:753 start_codon:yes stop_codon:yes gene_type:complete